MKSLDDVAFRGYNKIMKVVGIRDLKDHLSEYMRLTRKGEIVLVTDRGVAVAELRPANVSTLANQIPRGLADLVSQGIVSLGEAKLPDAYPRMKRLAENLSSLQLLDKERNEE